MMIRKRVSCGRMLDFRGVKNPCHKILCDIVAEEVEETAENKVLVKGLREVRVKCSSHNCKQITTITINEEVT
jgi:hypothetical protein